MEATLSAAEAANLWNQYMGDSSAICFNTFFLQNTEDSQIKSFLEQAISDILANDSSQSTYLGFGYYKFYGKSILR